MAVWLAGLLGFIVGWLIRKWGDSDYVKALEADRDYYCRGYHFTETQYSTCSDLLETEIKKRMDLETRHSQLSQILNGVPLNEVQ